MSSDRSPLYPRTIAEVWPQAKHQLCVFHVISEINDHVLDAVREVRKSLKPKRIKKGRGRPSKRIRARVKKLKEQREQADRLFRRRHLIVTKQSNLKTQDKKTLDELLSLSPTLGVLRSFVVDLHKLFSVHRSKVQAWKVWRRMRRKQNYLKNDHLSKALEVLSNDNMVKLLHYLDNPTAIRSKVRTNNHVERCNRVLRYLEKVRYKWRRRKTMLQEFCQVAFRKKLYESIEQLQEDVDQWLRSYNEERPHSGRYCFGKTPRQTFDDSKKLAEQKMLDQLLQPSA